jgi:hypothetical protein
LSESRPPGLTGIFGLYVDIARFRRGPEDLPVSVQLLLFTTAAYVVVDALMLLVLPLPDSSPAALIAIDVAVTLLWYGLVLRLAGKPERFLQTASAVMGFQLVVAPAFIASGWLFLKYQNVSGVQLLVAALRLALEIWMLVVFGRILRAATGWPLFAGIALAFSQELLTWLVASAVFPTLVKG